MKIIVMKFSSRSAWWKDYIGKVFPVKTQAQENYIVTVNKKRTEKILKSDCEVIER